MYPLPGAAFGALIRHCSGFGRVTALLFPKELSPVGNNLACGLVLQSSRRVTGSSPPSCIRRCYTGVAAKGAANSPRFHGTTGVVSHPDCLLHDMGNGHVERPERLRAVLNLLIEHHGSSSNVSFVEGIPASWEMLELVHDRRYINQLRHMFEEADTTNKCVHIDFDTAVGPGTGRAAIAAAGCVITAIDLVFKGQFKNSFAAVRPPGHHAEKDRAMGFCFFNNVAIGAAYARKKWEAKKIAIVDWDVHHGNGTQNSSWDDSDTMYVSTHEGPYFFPGTGKPEDSGEHGQILNVELASGSGSAEFLEAYASQIIPAIKAFNPDLLMVSAGYDAHYSDALSSLHITEADYRQVTSQLLATAAEHCQGRAVFVLEGGYHLHGLAWSALATVEEMMKA